MHVAHRRIYGKGGGGQLGGCSDGDNDGDASRGAVRGIYASDGICIFDLYAALYALRGGNLYGGKGTEPEVGAICRGFPDLRGMDHGICGEGCDRAVLR